MKVRLKVLFDELRGGAWPPLARAVRCPVKSGNEQDLRPQLLIGVLVRLSILWRLPWKRGGRCRLR